MIWPWAACDPASETPHGPRLVQLKFRILRFLYLRCHLFMPDMCSFSVQCFVASVHARTELDLQGGRRRLERLEILQRLFVICGSHGRHYLGGCLISPCFHDLWAKPSPNGLGYHIQQRICLHLPLFDHVLPGLGKLLNEFRRNNALH